MSGLISQLFSTLSSTQQGTPPSHVLCFRPNPTDPNNTVVHPIGYPVDVPPLYTLVSSKSAKPNLLLFHGSLSPNNTIGTASFHALSSGISLTIHRQNLRMTLDQTTCNFTLESPMAGNLKWNAGEIIGSSFSLKDREGMKLALLRSGGFPGSGERKLEVFVTCEKEFLDLIVLSGFAAKAFSKEAGEAASEIIQAVMDG